MRMYDLIEKKKRGGELSEEEIRELITLYVAGGVPDYQMSALLMAIYFQGMTERETSALTDAMAKSGDTVDLSMFGERSVDKHSTGGVGDKTTLIVAPIVAAAGGIVAKMSGRGLGHTGGTVDKLESFPGFETSLSPERFVGQVKKCSLAVIGQSANLAPADKLLYALRDVTATVDSIPLIASSIMSKKLAAGTKSIVLDVKCGSGAFMTTPEAARELAEAMVAIGKSRGRRCAAIITDMDVPLGRAIGNTLEVEEAISVLRGSGPEDLTEVCLALATAMISRSLAIPADEARQTALDMIKSGRAYEKFCEWIGEQGGDVSYAKNPELFGRARYERAVLSDKDGYVSKINAEAIGLAAVALGAGRATKDSAIDFRAGIIMHAKVGDFVKAGEALVTLYTEREQTLYEAEARVLANITLCDKKPPEHKLIYGIIEG